jgi:hypothetical protein
MHKNNLQSINGLQFALLVFALTQLIKGEKKIKLFQKLSYSKFYSFNCFNLTFVKLLNEKYKKKR